MEPRRLFRFRFLAGLELAPGKRPIFTVTEVTRGRPPGYRTRLATIRRGRITPLTEGEAKRPRVQGSRVYFLRKVGERPQVHVLDLEGGEARPLTRLPAGVAGYAVGPGGALLAWGHAREEKPGEPRRFSAWPVKFDGQGRLSEAPVAVYLGRKKLFSRFPGVEEAAFGADGGLYFVAAADARARARWRTALWRWDGEGLRAVWEGEGAVSNLAAGPRGLAFFHQPYDEGGRFGEVRFLPYGEKRARVLFSGHLGNSVNGDLRYGAYAQGPRFGEDGRVYFLATEAGRGVLWAAGVEGGAEPVGAEGSVVAFAGAGEALLVEGFTRAPSLAWRGRVHDPNARLTADFLAPQALAYAAPEGHRVPGWVLLPPGPGPHPAILYIHGGPHTAFGEAAMFELQLFAAAGYAVVFGNPRGSTGYGEAFARLGGRWGEIDAADLLGLLDEALRRFPLDPKRVGVAGGSYGGYMTNWLTARHPDRFKAAVTDRSIANWTSFFGASDIGPPFTRMELFADPWKDPKRLWEKSPLAYADRVRAPTLVVHSEADHRCPIDQGETWFAALFDRGVKARFFRVPEEGHDLSRSGRPDRRVARLQAYLDWWREQL